MCVCTMCMDISLDMQCNNFMIPKMGKFTTSEKALSRDEYVQHSAFEYVRACVKMLCIQKICPKYFMSFLWKWSEHLKTETAGNPIISNEQCVLENVPFIISLNGCFRIYTYGNCVNHTLNHISNGILSDFNYSGPSTALSRSHMHPFDLIIFEMRTMFIKLHAWWLNNICETPIV